VIKCRMSIVGTWDKSSSVLAEIDGMLTSGLTMITQ
jgi:hypothetical protein